MRTQRLLLSTLLLCPALVASPLAETELAFKVSEGATNVKTFTSTVEMTLDSMDMTMNGSAPPMMPEIDMSLSAKTTVVVSDEYVAMAAGRPAKLLRTYDELGADTEMQMEIDMMGQTQTQDMPMNSASDLEGKQVAFTWNAEEEGYKASFPDGVSDEDLLEGLVEDMDLRGFLPPGPVSEGDEWQVPPSALAAMLAPGGNLKLMPEDMEMDNPMMGSNMGNVSDWFTESIKGEIVAKFAGVREGDAGKLAVIELRVDVSNAVDMTEMVAEAMENADLPPEAGDMDFDHMDIEIELTGEGNILWNLGAGRFQSMQLSGDMSMMMNMGMAISANGMDMDIEQTIEMSGTVNQSASVE